MTCTHLNLFFEVPPQQASRNRCEVVELHQISRADISECRVRDGGVQTVHLVALTFFSVSSVLVVSRTVHHIFHLHTCARGWRLAEDVLCEHLHIHQIQFVSSCFIVLGSMFLTVPLFRIYCTATKDDLTLTDGNQASHNRYSALRVAVWPFGQIQRSQPLSVRYSRQNFGSSKVQRQASLSESRATTRRQK